MATTVSKTGPKHVCVELFKIRSSVLSLPSRDDRMKIADEVAVTESGPGGFKDGQFAGSCPTSKLEEFFVSIVFVFMFAGPYLFAFTSLIIYFFGSWVHFVALVATTVFLCVHPVPKAANEASYFQSKLGVFLYRAFSRYFSYRFIFVEGTWDELVNDKEAWLGGAPPHGVLPVANLLTMPFVNALGRRFLGAPASVVFRTPFLRYMTFGGSVEVSGKALAAEIKKGNCCGLVPDGIAGVFQIDQNIERVSLKDRTGLARLCLRNGINIVPAYSIGNTKVMKAFHDPWGIMEYFSRKLRMTFIIPYGKFGLPVPYRTNITMVFGKLIKVKKVENPTQEQIQELHDRWLKSIKDTFDAHKAAVGWKEKELQFL